jgi:hypothetical protein
MARALDPAEAKIFNEPGQAFAVLVDSAENLLKRQEEALEPPPELSFWFSDQFTGRTNS